MRTGRKYIAVLNMYAIGWRETDFRPVYPDSALGSVRYSFRVCGSKGEAKRAIRRFVRRGFGQENEWVIKDATDVFRRWFKLWRSGGEV